MCPTRFGGDVKFVPQQLAGVNDGGLAEQDGPDGGGPGAGKPVFPDAASPQSVGCQPTYFHIDRCAPARAACMVGDP